MKMLNTLFRFVAIQILISGYTLIYAQDLPNKDFELWKKGENGESMPVGWITQNEPGFNTIVKSEGYEGKSSVKLIVLWDDLLKKTIGGRISTSFAVQPNSRISGLTGHYKGSSVGNDTLVIELKSVRNEMIIASSEYSTMESTNGWKEFLLEISPDDLPGNCIYQLNIYIKSSGTSRKGTFYCIDNLNLNIKMQEEDELRNQ